MKRLNREQFAEYIRGSAREVDQLIADGMPVHRQDGVIEIDLDEAEPWMIARALLIKAGVPVTEEICAKVKEIWSAAFGDVTLEEAEPMANKDRFELHGRVIDHFRERKERFLGGLEQLIEEVRVADNSD